MKEFTINEGSNSFIMKLPTSLKEITADYLNEVTEHIKIAPYYGDEDNNNIINNSINSETNGRLSFRGKKGNDNVLLELKKILVMIYKDNYDDLREALKDYEDLIKSKVSLNL